MSSALARLSGIALGGVIACGNSERNPHAASGGVSSSSGGSVSQAGTMSGGAGSASGGASSAGRGPVNPWAPTNFALDSPGWRNSDVPFCDPHLGRPEGSALWADSRGVFALLNTACIPKGSDLPFCPPDERDQQGTSLSVNDGSGWRVLKDGIETGTLAGIEAGPLLSQRWGCPAAQIDASSGSSQCEVEATFESSSQQPFAVRDEQAYVVAGRSLYQRSGASWRTLVDNAPESLNAVWAGAETLYLAGDYTPYAFTTSEGVLRALPKAPASRYTAVWGFADDDVWFGDSAGNLLHYDGATYTRVSAITAGPYRDITELWGQEGTLYFSSGWHFGRVVAGQVESLIAGVPYEDPHLAAFWGTSTNELFLAFNDSAFEGTACGATFFVYFDGKAFHRF